jgi:hypothetical protein
VVLGFDASGAALAQALRDALTGLGVEVRPLMKGASRPYLEEHKTEVQQEKRELLGDIFFLNIKIFVCLEAFSSATISQAFRSVAIATKHYTY